MLVHGALCVPIAESSKVNKTKAGKGKKMRGKEGVICVLVAISSHGSSQQQQIGVGRSRHHENARITSQQEGKCCCGAVAMLAAVWVEGWQGGGHVQSC